MAPPATLERQKTFTHFNSNNESSLLRRDTSNPACGFAQLTNQITRTAFRIIRIRIVFLLSGISIFPAKAGHAPCSSAQHNAWSISYVRVLIRGTEKIDSTAGGTRENHASRILILIANLFINSLLQVIIPQLGEHDVMIQVKACGLSRIDSRVGCREGAQDCCTDHLLPATDLVGTPS